MLNERSKAALVGVNEKLIRVVARASDICKVNFIVTEGLRTEVRQRQLMRAGASKTMNSKHLVGRAIDVAPIIGNKLAWDWPPFYIIAASMKQAAEELGVKIVWGGDWKSFKDGPHYELAEGE